MADVNLQTPTQPDATGPMPNTKEDVQKWLSKEGKAEQYRSKIAARYRWKDFTEEFKGRFEIIQQSTDIQINALNLIFAYVKTEIPALYLRDPYIKVNPKKNATIESSKILEAAINAIWRIKKIKRENKKNIQDGKLVGHSWFKTGYTGKSGTVEMDNGLTMETIESEDYFGYRIPWDCVTFNTDSIDAPFDSAWICHTNWVPLEDAKKNPRYKNTDQLKATSRKKDSYYSTTNSTDTPEFIEEMACLKEFWDIKNKKVFTLSPGVDDYIEAPKEWPYEMKGFPFSQLCFNPVNDEAYGLPDVFMFEPQVIELMKIRAAQLDHIKRFNRQLLTTPGNFGDDAKDQVTLAVTGALIECEDPTKVMPLPYPQYQQDAYAVEERLKEDMINISGQSPQERGATQKTTTRTFRELAQIQRGAENRRSEQIDMVEDFIEDISGNFVALLQQFADLPYYVRVTGEAPEEIQKALANRPSAQMPGAVTTPQGFTFTKEDIQGEFDYEVVAGSTAPLDKMNTIDTILQILQYAQPLGIAPGGPLTAALGKMLAEQLGIQEIKKAIDDEAVYQAQKQKEAAEQQQIMMNMEIAKDAAKTQIDAEKVATKQNEVLLQSLEMYGPQTKPVSEAKN